MKGYKVKIGNMWVRFVCSTTKNITLYAEDQKGKFLSKSDVTYIKQLVGEAHVVVEEYDIQWEKV